MKITTPFSSKHRKSQKQTARRLRRGGRNSFLGPEDWQCFHSLPPKIQQTQFSKEEQQVLQRIHPADDIADAADLALYKFEERHRAFRRSAEQSSCELIRPSSARASSLSSSSQESTEQVDSAIEMEDSLLDSFRWLDEDGDLDLTLDAYHAHVADSAAVHSPSQRRLPSFRRTLSFTRGRASTSNASHRALHSSQSFGAPFSDLASSQNRVRPGSSQPMHARHVSHRSTSSIDPSAQYYHDPEARLKLRVYLASPQKFDEAIEFGFPSLDNNNSNKENIRPQTDYRPVKRPSPDKDPQDSGRTFLDDDTVSLDLDLNYFPTTNDHHNTKKKEGKSDEVATPGVHRRPQPLPPLPETPWSPPAGARHHREMTLKMTLTRPDLRTADDSYQKDDDPLRLAELPPADENHTNIWDDFPEQPSVMKKMWRKIRRRRD